jgi:hypothetical protein
MRHRDRKHLLMIFGFVIGASMSLATCNKILNDTAPIVQETYKETKDYVKFRETCRELCGGGEEFVIIGEPFPGKVDTETFCICTLGGPRVAAKWK